MNHHKRPPVGEYLSYPSQPRPKIQKSHETPRFGQPLKRPSGDFIGACREKPCIFSSWENHQNYSLWKKSCTSWYGKYSIIHKVLYIPGGAGFLPSTLFYSKGPWNLALIIHLWSSVWPIFTHIYPYLGEVKFDAKMVWVSLASWNQTQNWRKSMDLMLESHPIASMYGIYTYIYHKKSTKPR